MADIKHWGMGGGNGIEAYTPEDPYYYEIDNRPLLNLVENDEKLNRELQSLVPKYPLEVLREDFEGGIDTFTFPNGEVAIPGSLMVFLNGVMYNPHNIVLINGGTQFKIINDDILPDKYDNFYVIYRTAEKPSGILFDDMIWFKEDASYKYVFEDGIEFDEDFSYTINP